MSTFRQAELFPRLPAATEEWVRGLLEPYYPLLWRTIMDPWRDLQGRRATDPAFRRRSGRDLAWWLHGEMRYQARELFAEQSLKPIELSNGMLALHHPDELLVTIKKLKRQKRKEHATDLRRSNTLTVTNQNYHDQRRMPAFPAVPRVVLGYLLTKEETDITIYIAYPRTKARGFRWHYELPDQSHGELGLVQPPPDAPTDEGPPKGYTVTPKKNVTEGERE